MKPVGLTQRVSVAQPHGERRDALARDWYPFLKALGRAWVALPNDAESALSMAKRFDLGGLILTGGEDLGQSPERDETEAALFDWGLKNSRPVLGVCRGFQFIVKRLGGGLEAVDPARHRARRHVVEFNGGARREVNSYHNFAPADTVWPLTALARCPEDGVLEAAVGPGLLGLSWHPEREMRPVAADLDIIKRFLSEP